MPRIAQRPDVRAESNRLIGDESIGIFAAAPGDINDVRRFAVLVEGIAKQQQEFAIIWDAEFRCHQIQRCTSQVSRCLWLSNVDAAREPRSVRRGVNEE